MGAEMKTSTSFTVYATVHVVAKEQIAGNVAITSLRTYTHACMDQYDVLDPSVAIAMHACTYMDKHKDLHACIMLHCKKRSVYITLNGVIFDIAEC